MPLVDFDKLKTICEEDSASIARQNLLEQTWLTLDRGKTHLADCSLEEIVEWFQDRFPAVGFTLRNIPDNPSPMMKSSLFSEMIHIIGQHWTTYTGIPYIDGKWSEFEDKRKNPAGVTLH